MKKLTVVIFLLTAAVILWFYLNPVHTADADADPSENDIQYSKVIIPAVPDVDTTTSSVSNDYSETLANFGSLSLNAGETLLQSYSVILRSDAGEDSEDQICAIRRNNNPYIILIIGIYDQNTAMYVRAAEIETPVIRLNTFSVSTMDMTGDHKNEIVFTGFEENQTIMQVYVCNVSGTSMKPRKVADIRSEGTISIQEVSRSDAYALGIASGESYSIYDYQPVQSSTGSSLDQLQIIYSWDKGYKSYNRTSSKLITSKIINSQEIDRILDGTRESFTKFLSGLWYKTQMNSDESRFIFFDEANGEIICLVNDNQELYGWTSDWMRRNGMTINTTNKSMSVLTRQLVVTLVAADEIKISANDNLLMVIGEETLWDGNYKKVTTPMTIQTPTVETTTNLSERLLTDDNSWYSADGEEIRFSETDWSQSGKGTSISSGIYSTTFIQDQELIQFRSADHNPLFNGWYSVIFDKPQPETEVATFQPVTVSMSKIKPAGSTIRLERAVPVEADAEGDIN